MTSELVYVSGGELGLRLERRAGGGFVIVDHAGATVTDDQTLDRVRALKIPPAWTDVWIAATPNAHLQATGHDSKGRRQYLYHPAWRAQRDEEKFDDMLEFAQRLPVVRAKATELLALQHPERARGLALAVRLLDIGLFRVGWDRYARDNGHVGLTTLRREHVTLHGPEVRFSFVAKSGKRRRMTVRDRQSVRVLGSLKRRRGEPDELLVYRSRGAWHRIHAQDVNNTLRCWGQGPYSAKEFRTWSATVLAAVSLAREHASGARGPTAVSRAVRQVSAALGNTPAVARASYIDPRVIELFEHDVVIGLPDEQAAVQAPLAAVDGDGLVVVELPTDVDGDALRLDTERRVLDLIRLS